MSQIYERIINANSTEAGKAAMAIIDTLQGYIEADKGAQAIGLCAAFRLFCERFNLDIQDVFSATGNLISSAQGDIRKDFQAVRDYLDNEMRL
jgi:hypothetical protein